MGLEIVKNRHFAAGASFHSVMLRWLTHSFLFVLPCDATPHLYIVLHHFCYIHYAVCIIIYTQKDFLLSSN